MTDVRAYLKRLDLSPKKVRLVLNLVRGRKASTAADLLAFANKRAAVPVLKLLRSAIANATHNHQLRRESLKIKEIRADEGPIENRWRPRAHGRAFPIRQRSSRVTIVLTGEPEEQKQA